MQFSVSPTLWVIIKANTYSKWDKCNYILLHLSIGYCNHLRGILGRVMAEEISSFYFLSIWDAPFGWFIHEGDGFEDFLSSPELWSFITFDSHDELKRLTKVTQSFKEEYLSLFKSGTAMFQAYSEYTNEDYHSVEFPLHEIISLLEHGNDNG